MLCAASRLRSRAGIETRPGARLEDAVDTAATVRGVTRTGNRTGYSQKHNPVVDCGVCVIRRQPAPPAPPAPSPSRSGAPREVATVVLLVQQELQCPGATGAGLRHRQ